MTNKQLFLLALSLAGFSLYLNNIFKIKSLKRRSILLATHSNDIFLDSEKIKEYREKLNPNLNLNHEDNRILEQIKLFKRDYTKEELLIMKNNIQILQVDYKGGSLFLGGEYNFFKNMILLNPLYDTSEESKEYISALNHELHHLASNLGKIENYVACGFQQLRTDKLSHIGKGLTEGYTEYLSKNNLNKENYSYKKM